MKMDKGVKLYLFSLTLLAHIRKIALYFVISHEGLSEAKALVLWSPGVKSQLTGKYPDAGKD